jgi:hypothetical protein
MITGIGDFNFLERLHELAGHGANIGAAMALDLGLVAHAAKTEAIELPPQRRGHGSPMLVLPTPGGSDEQQDRAGYLRLEGTPRQEIRGCGLSHPRVRRAPVEHLAACVQVEVVLECTPQGTEVAQSR